MRSFGNELRDQVALVCWPKSVREPKSNWSRLPTVGPILVVAVVGLTACSSMSSGGSVAGSDGSVVSSNGARASKSFDGKNACQLASESEVSQAVGHTIEVAANVTADSPSLPSVCSYVFRTDSGGGTNLVLAYDKTQKQIDDDLKIMCKNRDRIRIPDAGNEAFSCSKYVFVLTGDGRGVVVSTTLSLSTGHEAASLAAATAIAKIAASRLP